jgi:hypothetical protein
MNNVEVCRGAWRADSSINPFRHVRWHTLCHMYLIRQIISYWLQRQVWSLIQGKGSHTHGLMIVSISTTLDKAKISAPINARSHLLLFWGFNPAMSVPTAPSSRRCPPTSRVRDLRGSTKRDGSRLPLLARESWQWPPAGMCWWLEEINH